MTDSGSDTAPGHPAQTVAPATAAPSTAGATVEPETIFVAQNSVRGLAIAGDHAYFSEADEYEDRFGSDGYCKDGKVGWIRRDGVGAPVWVTPRPECPGSVVVVGDYVVFREPGTVVAQPLSQNGPTKRKGNDQSFSDYALVADAERVFFLDTRSYRLNQWSPSTNATRTLGRIDVHDDLAIAGRFIVITEYGRVRLLPVDGSAERILVTSTRDRFCRAAFHGAQVFVVREVDGQVGAKPVRREILRIDTTLPQAPPTVVHRTKASILNLAADDRRVYFVSTESEEYVAGRLESVDLDTRENRLLWSRPGPIDNLVLHEAHAYFSADNRILRIGKQK